VTLVCGATYLGAWIASVLALYRLTGGSLVEPLFVLVIFGLFFPAIAFAATRRLAPPIETIARPRAELAAALVYLVLFSLVVLGWGFSFLRAQTPPGRAREILILVVKLATMCLGPALLFRALGSRAVPRSTLSVDSKLALPAIALGILLLAFQAVFGRGLRDLSELHPAASTLAWAIPAAFVWLTLEAGLPEELLFRAVLQTRVAAVLRTEPGAIFVSALLFGLAHAPGLYLRGGQLAEGLPGPPTVAWAAAYSVAIVSPAGLLFGTLWWRTHSFVLVVLLHAWMDLLPNLAPLIRTWTS